MAAYTKIVLIAMCLVAVLSLTEAQWDFQGSVSPNQASYSGSLGGSGYRGSAQGNYQGSQGGYRGSQSGYQGSQGGYQGSQSGYQGSQGGYDQGYQGNYYAN